MAYPSEPTGSEWVSGGWVGVYLFWFKTMQSCSYPSTPDHAPSGAAAVAAASECLPRARCYFCLVPATRKENPPCPDQQGQHLCLQGSLYCCIFSLGLLWRLRTDWVLEDNWYLLSAFWRWEVRVGKGRFPPVLGASVPCQGLRHCHLLDFPCPAAMESSLPCLCMSPSCHSTHHRYRGSVCLTCICSGTVSQY